MFCLLLTNPPSNSFGCHVNQGVNPGNMAVLEMYNNTILYNDTILYSQPFLGQRKEIGYSRKLVASPMNSWKVLISLGGMIII